MKKSTKISVIIALVGLVFFVVGIVISAVEIISGKWTTFVEDVVDSTGIVNVGAYDMDFKESYGSNIDRIIVNVDDDKVKYKESNDDQVYIEYGKNIVVSREDTFITISNENNQNNNGVNVYDEENDSYVSIGEDGLHVESEDANVSIDMNGVSIETDEDGEVNINIPFFGKIRRDYDVIIYLPKDFKGNIVD